MEYSSVKRGSIDFIDVGFRSSFEIKLQMTHKYELYYITHYRVKIYPKDHNDFWSHGHQLMMLYVQVTTDFRSVDHWIFLTNRFLIFAFKLFNAFEDVQVVWTS